MTLPVWREETLSRQHDRKSFDCGQSDLNVFLMRYARQANDSGASKTYVAVDDRDGRTILGYYTLSPAQLAFDIAPEPARPAGGGRHPIGGYRLARLAVSKAVQERGLGGQLLVSAARRCIAASVHVGGSMLLIDAKDGSAAAWYAAHGALEVPGMPLTLVLPFATVVAATRAAGGPLP